MNSRVITTVFDGTQGASVPLFQAGLSSSHFALFNSTPAAGFGPITPRLVAHYADSGEIAVPLAWQGSVDVTLFDGVGGPFPTPQIGYGQATFAAASQVTQALSRTFVDAFYRVRAGAVTITDGLGPIIANPDYSSRVPNALSINASAQFNGTVDLVATGGLAGLTSMGAQLATAIFTGNEDFIDVVWPTPLAAYVIVVGVSSAAPAFVNVINRTTTGCRLQPVGQFAGFAEVAVFPTPINALLQSATATFNGTQDSIAVTWTDPGIAFSILWGVTLSDGLGNVIPWLTSRSSTGATINVSQRFSGTVDLVIVPNR